MPKQTRRRAAAVSPMPARLNSGALLRVSDQSGQVIRQEEIKAGTHLGERLQLAHKNYERQGWTVNELRPGQWAFVAELGSRRLIMAIRPLTPHGTVACVDRVPLAHSRGD